MFQFILSWSPVVLSSVLLVLIGMTLVKKPETWGRRLAIVWIFGLLICLVAALRDGYGFSGVSVLSFTGITASLLSGLGITVTILSLTAVVNKKQAYRKKVFMIVSLVFVVKLIVMEAIRLGA